MRHRCAQLCTVNWGVTTIKDQHWNLCCSSTQPCNSALLEYAPFLPSSGQSQWSLLGSWLGSLILNWSGYYYAGNSALFVYPTNLAWELHVALFFSFICTLSVSFCRSLNTIFWEYAHYSEQQSDFFQACGLCLTTGTLSVVMISNFGTSRLNKIREDSCQKNNEIYIHLNDELMGSDSIMPETLSLDTRITVSWKKYFYRVILVFAVTV